MTPPVEPPPTPPEPIPAAPPRAYGTASDLTALALLDSQIDPGVFGDDSLYTLDELADKTGWSRDELDQLWLWAGLPFVDRTQEMFKDDDVAGLTRLREFRNREGFDDAALASIIRAIGTSIERLAVWQVEALTKHLADSRGLGDTASRLEAAAFAPAQTPILRFLVEKLWLRHYAAAIHRLTTENILRRGVSDDDQQFPHTCGVGFAWLVDYVAHTRDFGLGEWSEFVQDFHNRVADIVNSSGGRIINNTGDFVLYVSARPDTGAEIALRISEMRDEGFTADVRGAIVWSRVLSTFGDIYGPGVNLSLLLSQEAAPNTVLTDPETAAMLSRGPFELTPLPERELGGLGPVAPVQIARKSSG